MSEMWVCSKWNAEPKDSEKFRVLRAGDAYYFVQLSNGAQASLLNDHYRPCDPPEQWERVEVTLSPDPQSGLGTSIIVNGSSTTIMDRKIGYILFNRTGYRVVSLVVERKVTR